MLNTVEEFYILLWLKFHHFYYDLKYGQGVKVSFNNFFSKDYYQ